MKISLKFFVLGLCGALLFTSGFSKKAWSDPEVMAMEKLIKVFGKNRISEPHLLAQSIIRESRAHKMDPLMVLAVIKTESSFHSRSVSRVGAIGLMQVMPKTAHSIVTKNGRSPSHEGQVKKDLYDPVKNIQIGIRYLNTLVKRFNNNQVLYLTAYNIGPTRLNILIKNSQDFLKKYGYAKKVLKAYQEIQSFHTHVIGIKIAQLN